MTELPPPFPPSPPPGWPSSPPPGGAGWPTTQAWSSGQAPPPKRGNSAGLIIGSIIVVLLLVIVGLGVALLLGRSSSGDGPVASVASASVPASEPPVTPATGLVARPEVPPGFKLVADDARGYAFVMPSAWTSAALTPEAIDAIIAKLGTSNPELASALEQFKAVASSGGLAFGYDSSAGAATGQTPTLNLLALPSGGLTLDQVAAQLELGLSAVNAKQVGKEKVEVGGKAGLEVTLELTAAGVGTIRQQQLYLSGADRLYVFTVAGVDDATADTILRSLRVP